MELTLLCGLLILLRARTEGQHLSRLLKKTLTYWLACSWLMRRLLRKQLRPSKAITIIRLARLLLEITYMRRAQHSMRRERVALTERGPVDPLKGGVPFQFVEPAGMAHAKPRGRCRLEEFI